MLLGGAATLWLLGDRIRAAMLGSLALLFSLLFVGEGRGELLRFSTLLVLGLAALPWVHAAWRGSLALGLSLVGLGLARWAQEVGLAGDSVSLPGRLAAVVVASDLWLGLAFVASALSLTEALTYRLQLQRVSSRAAMDPFTAARRPWFQGRAPCVLGLALVVVFLLSEGRPLILEAALCSGLAVGLALPLGPLVTPSRGRSRPWARRWVTGALLLGLGLWSWHSAEGRGVGPYTHPEGLNVTELWGYEVVEAELALPSALTVAPDGRVFVADFVEKSIWVLEEGPGGDWGRRRFARWPSSEGPAGAVRSSEAGLWGLAYSAASEELYAMGVVSWSSSPGPDGRPRGRSQVIAFADEPGGSPRQRLVLDDLPAGVLHSGGALVVDGKGTLYVSVGEGGYGGPGRQDYVGTILRVDGKEAQVVARGLRNPYGLALGTDGRLYATENGPDCCDRLLLIESGVDFGWRPGEEESAKRRDAGGSSGNTGRVLWSSGPARIGPTGIVAEGDRLYFATWHTGAVHEVEIGSEGTHRIVFEAPLARPPEDSAYRFHGSLTGLAFDPSGRLWFSSMGAVGRFHR